MSRAEAEQRIAELEADREKTRRELDALPEREREAIKQRFLSREQVFGVLHSSVTGIGKERTKLEKRLSNLEKALAIARDVLVDIDAAERAEEQRQALAAAKKVRRLVAEIEDKGGEDAAAVNRRYEEYSDAIEQLDRLRHQKAALFANDTQAESDWRNATAPDWQPMAGFATFFFERVSGVNLSTRSPEISGDNPVRRRPSGMPSPGARGTAREQKAGFPGLAPEGFHVSEGWGEG